LKNSTLVSDPETAVAAALIVMLEFAGNVWPSVGLVIATVGGVLDELTLTFLGEEMVVAPVLSEAFAVST
jgi:hypothetical protein